MQTYTYFITKTTVFVQKWQDKRIKIRIRIADISLKTKLLRKRLENAEFTGLYNFAKVVDYFVRLLDMLSKINGKLLAYNSILRYVASPVQEEWLFSLY